MKEPHVNRWLGVGALASAGAVALTWVCCLPIVAGLVGVGFASLGARIEPARPYLLTAGAVFVATGLYRSYRPRRDCSDGACSPTSPGRRAFLWLCGATIVFAASMPYLIALGDPAPPRTPAMHAIHSIDTVRDRFNANVDRPRFITILSPT